MEPTTPVDTPRDPTPDHLAPDDPVPVDRSTMHAIVCDAYGSADVLRLAEIERPHVAGDEVLIRVQAAGLDRGTWHVMTGTPYLLRLGFGLRRPRNPVPGLDVAGTVVAVGAEVTRFTPGDEVFGTARGSFAEYAAAREDKLAQAPTNLRPEQAAAVPVSGLTALQGLRDAGRVRAGQHVLIVGASGGVGTFAVQIAKAFGAEVTGVCSTSKVELVRSLGADHVVDHTREDLTASTTRYDVILDIGGSTPLRKLRRLLETRGTIAVVGGEEGGHLTGVVPRLLAALALSTFTRHRLVPVVSKEHHTDLEVLREMIGAGQITPALDRTFPLAQAADAMRRLEAGEVRGKVTITIGTAPRRSGTDHQP